MFSPEGAQFAFNRKGASTTGEVRLGTAGANLGPTSFLAPISGGAGAASTLSWQPLNPPACSMGSPKAAKSGKRVNLSVNCANENATVTITGVGKAPKPKGKGGGVKDRKATRFSIPPVTAEVPAGGSADVVVLLPKKAAKAIKKATKAGKKAKVTLNATFADSLGATAGDSAKVKFKARKRGR